MTTTQTKLKAKEQPKIEHMGLMLSPEEKRAVDKGHMVIMHSLRSLDVSNTSGHSCHFDAKTPRLVPRALVATAMERGCAPFRAEDVKIVEDLEAVTHQNFAPSLKRALLFRVLDSIAKTNNMADFAASGVPKKDLVTERLGFDMTVRDLQRAWQEYLSLKNSGDDALPTHDSADAAYKIVNAEDRDELLLIGMELGYEESKLDGLGNRELRALLLGRYKE